MTKFQIIYRSPDHSKGPDFWQKTTQVFKTRAAAEASMQKSRAFLDPAVELKIIEKG